MSRPIVLSLCLLLLTTSTVRADEEKAPQTPEVRAMHKLMDSKKVWGKIGKRKEWRSGGFFVIEDIEDLSPIEGPENSARKENHTADRVLVKLDKRKGVIHWADWIFHGPDDHPASFLSIIVKTYADEASCQKACKRAASLAEFSQRTVRRSGKRTTVVSEEKTTTFEARSEISVQFRGPPDAKQMRIAETILSEFKKLVKAEEKADAKRKKEEEKMRKEEEKGSN